MSLSTTIKFDVTPSTSFTVDVVSEKVLSVNELARITDLIKLSVREGELSGSGSVHLKGRPLFYKGSREKWEKSHPEAILSFEWKIVSKRYRLYTDVKRNKFEMCERAIIHANDFADEIARLRLELKAATNKAEEVSAADSKAAEMNFAA